jgi:hypothetical protein
LRLNKSICVEGDDFDHARASNVRDLQLVFPDESLYKRYRTFVRRRAITRLGRDQQTLLSNLPAGDVPEHFREYGYAMQRAAFLGHVDPKPTATYLTISDALGCAGVSMSGNFLLRLRFFRPCQLCVAFALLRQLQVSLCRVAASSPVREPAEP